MTFPNKKKLTNALSQLKPIAALAAADPQKALLSVLVGDPGSVDLDNSFALACGLTTEAAPAPWRPRSFRRVEARGTSFSFGWTKWQALGLAIAAALADYHKKVPDNPGLERGRLPRALEMRLLVPAFETAPAPWSRMVPFGARGRGSSYRVTRSV